MHLVTGDYLLIGPTTLKIPISAVHAITSFGTSAKSTDTNLSNSIRK